VGAGVEGEVPAVEVGELGEAEPGLEGERKQSSVPSSFPASRVGSSEQRLGFVVGEEGTMALSWRFWGIANTRAINSACSGCRSAA